MKWKIQKNGKLNSEKTGKIWKKDSNSEKIWKIQKKIVKWYGKYGWNVKWYGKYGRKVRCIVKRWGNMEETRIQSSSSHHLQPHSSSSSSSHQTLRKGSGRDDHCTEFSVITCWKCCMKKISEIITLIQKKKKKKRKKKKNEEKKWKKRNKMKISMEKGGNPTSGCACAHSSSSDHFRWRQGRWRDFGQACAMVRSSGSSSNVVWAVPMYYCQFPDYWADDTIGINRPPTKVSTRW